MQYHCVNDPIWSYCHNEAKWRAEHERIMKENPDTKIINCAVLKCELDKSNCGMCYKDVGKIDNRLGKGVKEAIIPIVNKEVEKPKAKKKEKVQIEQGSFFE